MEKTLTDYEISSLNSKYCLADGHAYHDPHPAFSAVINDLPSIWRRTTAKTIPDAELEFLKTYSTLIESPALSGYRNFKICPTASNSIDVVAAALNFKGHTVGLVEPTFDNLALLLSRRKVTLKANAEVDLIKAVRTRLLNFYPGFKEVDVLFLVNPNNPTGTVFNEEDLRYICQECKRHKKSLIIDNCFRLFNRAPYDDYKIMIEEGVSFVSIEDTGKVWPTLDMKASLLVYSKEFKSEIEKIYNEIYLCTSPFTLSVLTELNKIAKKTGISEVLWKRTDEHRAYLQTAISDTALFSESALSNSTLSVEWINCAKTGLSDVEIRYMLEKTKVMVLPGRYFYWSTSHHTEAKHSSHFRVSLLKKSDGFKQAVDIMSTCFRGIKTVS